MSFDKEVDSIKKMLNLGGEIKVYTDEAASKFVNDNEEIYKNNYGVSLAKAFKNGHGMYLWWENEKVVIVKDSADLVNLAHELRHAWQHAHHIDKKFKFKKPKNSFWQRLYGTLLYPVSRTELDANWYALKYAFRNRLHEKNFFMAIRPFWAILSHCLIIFLFIFILSDLMIQPLLDLLHF